MSNSKKFLDYEGVKHLWSKISLEDYPNNETLIAVINAIDSSKADKEYVDGAIQTHTSDMQKQLDKKANDFSIEIYNGTSGNPKPVRFASFNYSSCNSENGIAAKISLVSGHGNGSSYAFLEDAIIRVTFAGDVEVDNFKYYG